MNRPNYDRCPMCDEWYNPNEAAILIAIQHKFAELWAKKQSYLPEAP